MRGLAQRFLAGLIRSYQILISPMLGSNCRFQSRCSRYALEAVTRHGALRGSWRAVKRLGRCHPWRPGGDDPVPPSLRDSRMKAAHHDPAQPARRSAADA